MSKPKTEEIKQPDSVDSVKRKRLVRMGDAPLMEYYYDEGTRPMHGTLETLFFLQLRNGVTSPFHP